MITAGKRKQTLQNNSLQCGIQPQGKPFSQVEFSILYSSCSKDSNEVKGFSTKRDLNSFSIVTHLTAKPKKNKRKQKKNKRLGVFFAGSSVPFFRQNLSRAWQQIERSSSKLLITGRTSN